MRRFHRRLAFLGCVSLAAAILWAAPPVIASTSGSQSTGNQAAAPADAPVPYSTTVVLLGSAKVIGALYQPTTPDPRQSTALFLTHENADEIGALDCLQLAQRGYTVLCVKSQYSEQAEANWDALAKDVAASVTYLRSLPTVRHVVLVGHSGGGPIVSYYQNVAEHGVSVCQQATRLDPCSSSLAGMPPADGVVLLDSEGGIAFDRLMDLDASVTNENNYKTVDESLNMYSTRNGYNPDASSDYSSAFINRYLKAQSNREDGLVAEATKLENKTAKGTGQYTDDAPMVVGRDGARLWEADLNLISHTQGKYPLISPQSPNGSAPQTIPSLRVPSADADDNVTFSGGANAYTASTYLSTSAISAPNLRVTADDITGIDWASTNTAPVENLPGVTTPLLIMGMTGHYWVVPAEMFYNSATQSTDKTLVFVKGASHGFTPCTACATTPGEFGDTVGETFNYVANWLDTRYK